jgi:Clostripain family
MVFMGADNLPEEEDLSLAAIEDLNEMRQFPSGGSLNVLVQLHGKDRVTREHIGVGRPVAVPADEQNATNGNALIAFMRWALKRARHRTTDYSLLVLWGHAYRFGIGHSATPTGDDALDFGELRDVLVKFQKEQQELQRASKTPTLDIVAFDACDLATIEMALQLHPFAEYLLASQITVPIPGWPYDRILDRAKNKKGERLAGPAEFGTYIVRRFCERYHAPPDGVDRDELRTVSLTLLDLRHARQLEELTDQLAQRLAIALADDPTEQNLIVDLFNRSQTIAEKPFVDVADLCLNLMRFSSDAEVRQAAEQLGNLLLTPGPVKPEMSDTGAGRPFIVEHGRNSAHTARLHGVSLYAPHVAPSHDSAAASLFYEKFVFAKKTLWRGLVEALALPS